MGGLSGRRCRAARRAYHGRRWRSLAAGVGASALRLVLRAISSRADVGLPDVAPSVEHVAADAARVVRGERPGEVRIITPQRPRGEPGRYDVVEAADLVPSHKPQSFVPDPRYPAGVQERPYHTSQEEQGKVNAIGRDLNPALVLADTPTAVDGPPIVTSGVKRYVLGGNGRTMGIQRAFASPAVRENYKRELAARAAAFGIHPDRVAAMKAPVLVRVAEGVPATASKADLQAAVRRFNEGPTQELSPRARAVAEGKALRPVTIESIGTLLADGGDKSLRDLMRNKAQAFVTILQRDGLITNENRAAMQAGDGLTSFAKDRIEGMFLGRVLGTGERLDGTAPGVLQKLERITPQILRVEGVNPALSEIPTVQAAIDLMNRAQRAGGSVDDLLRQQGLAIAGGPAAPDAATIALARLLGSENQAQLAARFTKWAREAAVDPNQGMMFGKPPTAAEARRTLFAGTGTDAPSAPAAAIPTWGEFTKARMGEYMKKYGGHGPAMKQLSAEFKAPKGGCGGERTSPAGRSDAALTHRVVPAPEASKDPDWVFAKDAPPAPETVAALGVLKAAVEKVDRRLDTLASTLVRSGVKALNVARTEVVAGVAAHHAHEPEKVRADFRRDRVRYLQLAHNPSMALDSLDAATADIHPHAPAVAQAAAIDIATKVQYLASIVPHPFVAGALADPIDPPLSAIQTFRRLEGVVNDPTVLLKKAAAGTLSLDEVAAGDATARPLMEDLRQRTFEQIVIHGLPKDRHARLMLSFLFGRDLDGSIAMLDSNQATYHRAPSAPSQAMPPAAGAEALNVGQRSQTDMQRSAGRT